MLQRKERDALPGVRGCNAICVRAAAKFQRENERGMARAGEGFTALTAAVGNLCVFRQLWQVGSDVC